LPSVRVELIRGADWVCVVPLWGRAATLRPSKEVGIPEGFTEVSTFGPRLVWGREGGACGDTRFGSPALGATATGEIVVRGGSLWGRGASRCRRDAGAGRSTALIS
jgi:hypothetical protein